MATPSQRFTRSSGSGPSSTPNVVLFDPLATVPYYTAYLSRALLDQGVELQVCSISYYLDAGCFSSKNLRLDPGIVDVVGRFALPASPRRVLKLAEFGLNLSALALRFRNKPPEVFHIQFVPLVRGPFPLDLSFARYLQRRGTKLVLTVHDLLPHDTADRFRSTFQELYRSVDALICHSEHIRLRLQTEFGLPENRIFVIPHGPFFYDLASTKETSLQQRLGIPVNRKVVLWQGIIFPYKGVDILLAAWRKIEHQHKDAHLVIMGTGSPETLAAVRSQAASLGLQQLTLDLRFCSTEELVEAYRAAAVVVYPYRAITTSGALATGLALGKTIVASDLPVFRELLRNEENALLVPPQDPEALAAALLRLLEDDLLRKELATRVTEMHFGDASWRAIARDTLQVYNAILEEQT